MQEIPSVGHSIVFGQKGYESLASHVAENSFSTLFALVDSNTNEHCLPRFLSLFPTDAPIEIIEIESGESMKTIDTCLEVWNILNELGADRRSILINVGGGVITDLGGFIASTYKRGISFINVPTTLLGMVDAAIGGKNGVDLGNLKNQVGTISSPEMVLIDTEFLNTLSQVEMRSGLAEMLKHGLIADQDYWKLFLDMGALVQADLDSLIYGSVMIKNKIVLQDPGESGIRKALNFGHTLGHAIEGFFLSQQMPVLHGEAVAAGMVMESFLSMEKGLISHSQYLEIKNTIKDMYDDIIFDENAVTCILGLLRHDKKNEFGKIMFVLLDGIGKVKIDQQVDNDLIRNAFLDYTS